MSRPIVALSSLKICLAILATWVTFDAMPSQAAEIEIVDSPYCTMRLTGQIGEGDSERLRMATELLQESSIWLIQSGFQLSTHRQRLCLNSPGGSLLEAANLAAFVFEQGIGTVLEPRSECLSACAWIFMLGHALAEEGGSSSNRRMHFTARLGFHAPRLELPDRAAFDQNDIEAAQSTLIEAFAQILFLGNLRGSGIRTKPAIDSDLIQAAFEVGSGNGAYLIVDTVDEAGRWDIPVFGFEWPETISPEVAYVVCANLSRWPVERVIQDGMTVGADARRGEWQGYASPIPERPYWLVVDGPDSGYLGSRCIINIELSNGRIGACGFNEVNGANIGFFGSNCDFGEPENARLRYHSALAIFPPETRLADLSPASLSIIASNLRTRDAEQLATEEDGEPTARVPGIDDGDRVRSIDAGLLASLNVELSSALAAGREVASFQNLHSTCFPQQETLRVVLVNEFVTLRERAGFDAAILATIPLGSDVTLRGGPAFREAPESNLGCANACGEAGMDADYPSPRIAQCYQNNFLWFPVAYEGQRGWVAGRYLGE